MRIDHLGLDVSDYERSKAFYERALAPLGLKLLMEPAPEVGGFGGDVPFFWIGKRDRGPQTGVHASRGWPEWRLATQSPKRHPTGAKARRADRGRSAPYPS